MSTAQHKPVVAYIDRSTPAGCLAFAATEAQLRGCGLVAVIAAAGAATRVKPELDRVRALRPALPVTVEVAAGSRSIPEPDREASLVVFGGAHLAAVDIARGVGPAGPPVVVFRPTTAIAADPLPPVVIGLGPEPYNDMLEFAFAAAAGHRTSVRGVYSAARLGDRVDPAVESSWRDTLERWSEKYPGVAVEFSASAGLDAGVALDVASRSAQLVVVGASDAEGPASVAYMVARRASCPVAIVKIR
jgi:hypothetical protein